MGVVSPLILALSVAIFAVPVYVHWLSVVRPEDSEKFGEIESVKVVIAFRSWLALYFAFLFVRAKKNVHSLMLGLPLIAIGAVYIGLALRDQQDGTRVVYTEAAHKGSSFGVTKGLILLIVGAYASVSPSVHISVMTAAAVAAEFAQMLVALWCE